MAQTLRINFSYKSHTRQLPALSKGFLAPLPLPVLLQQLEQYLVIAKIDLLQPRQQVLDRIMQQA